MSACRSPHLSAMFEHLLAELRLAFLLLPDHRALHQPYVARNGTWSRCWTPGTGTGPAPSWRTTSPPRSSTCWASWRNRSLTVRLTPAGPAARGTRRPRAGRPRAARWVRRGWPRPWWRSRCARWRRHPPQCRLPRRWRPTRATAAAHRPTAMDSPRGQEGEPAQGSEHPRQPLLERAHTLRDQEGGSPVGAGKGWRPRHGRWPRKAATVSFGWALEGCRWSIATSSTSPTRRLRPPTAAPPGPIRARRRRRAVVVERRTSRRPSRDRAGWSCISPVRGRRQGRRTWARMCASRRQ